MAVDRSAVHGMVLTAALAAGVLGVPGSAQAARPVDVTSPVSCDSGSAADKAVAARLRPLMSGRRLGGLVSGQSIACARIIVAHVRERGLGPRAAVIALTTAIAESTLHNHRVALDHDSLGLFQQRPSQGWGRPEQLTDVRYATGKFLDAMVRKYPGNSWMTGDIGAICQRVQGSAHPRAYAPEARDAALIVGALWGSPMPATSSPAVPVAPSTAAPAPTGPLQRVTATAGVELGPLPGRHDVALADWNGDRRDDLIVVNGTGAATGKTEVRVMDGDFSHLWLTTATAFGPTDTNHAYVVADFSGDARADLMVVQRSATSTGRTEVRVVDGASGFQQVLVAAATALPQTDERHRFSATDWNADGRTDLVVAQTSGTASKKVEVQVLDGAANFERPLIPALTTAEAARDGVEVVARDWNDDRRPDLVVMQTSGTPSGKVDVRVWDAASRFRKTLLRTSTAQPATDDRHELLVADVNGDRRTDVAVVQKTGTASGRPEVSILGG